MRAVILSEYGGPEMLLLTDVPEPRIGANEVLVRVRACALNHLDLWLRRGLPNQPLTFPHILGSDIAGEVAEIGSAVTNVHRGDKVLLAPGVSCGQCAQCLAGQDNFCKGYTLFGSGVPGGYAQFVKAPAVNAIPIPGIFTFEEAAAVPLVFLTAWHMLLTRARLRPAEEALVIGASSGVGSAAIQIAKAVGARVIAASTSETKLARAKELGAGEAIDGWPGRGRGVRARWPGHVGTEHLQLGARRPARHLRRHHGTGWKAEHRVPLRAPSLNPRVLHGREIGAFRRP